MRPKSSPSTTQDGNLTYMSPSVIKILGYSVEEMIAGKDMERMGRDDATPAGHYLRTTEGKSGIAMEILEYSFIKKNGERIRLSTSVQKYAARYRHQGLSC